MEPAPRLPLHISRPKRWVGTLGRALTAGLMLLGGFLALAPAPGAGATAALIDPGPVAMMDVGSQHACALTSSGALRCWGQNRWSSHDGRLGDGTGANSSIPVGVVGISDATHISAGNEATCAVVEPGEVRCWGTNEHGAFGDGTTNDSDIPVAVSGITNATDVTVGVKHACATIANGTVKCWGRNSNGQLGNGTTIDSLVPTTVTGITNAVFVTAYFNSNCALLATGTVKCWGQNLHGELGNGTTVNSSTPVPVSNLTGVTALSGGQYSVCATTALGARCWGRNNSGQLGDGTLIDSSVPVSVVGAVQVDGVAVGRGHACARRNNGTMTCWGDNSAGQLGDGTTTSTTTAHSVPGLTGITSISAGGFETCAVAAGPRCWGSNLFGQVGNGTTVTAKSPVEVVAGLCEEAPYPDFDDVPFDVYYTDAVSWLAAMGITTGTSPGIFSPNAKVARKDMAVFIWRAFAEPAPQGTNPFGDVPNGKYYTAAITWLAEQGISTGTSPGIYSPNSVVTRGQMASFLHRATGSLDAPQHSFTDVSPSASYNDAVSWLAHVRISTGTSPGVYSPNGKVSRKDMAVFLNRRGCGAG